MIAPARNHKGTASPTQVIRGLSPRAPGMLGRTWFRHRSRAGTMGSCELSIEGPTGSEKAAIGAPRRFAPPAGRPSGLARSRPPGDGGCGSLIEASVGVFFACGTLGASLSPALYSVGRYARADFPDDAAERGVSLACHEEDLSGDGLSAASMARRRGRHRLSPAGSGGAGCRLAAV